MQDGLMFDEEENKNFDNMNKNGCLGCLTPVIILLIVFACFVVAVADAQDRTEKSWVKGGWRNDTIYHAARVQNGYFEDSGMHPVIFLNGRRHDADSGLIMPYMKKVDTPLCADCIELKRKYKHLVSIVEDWRRLPYITDDHSNYSDLKVTNNTFWHNLKTPEFEFLFWRHGGFLKYTGSHANISNQNSNYDSITVTILKQPPITSFIN